MLVKGAKLTTRCGYAAEILSTTLCDQHGKASDTPVLALIHDPYVGDRVFRYRHDGCFGRAGTEHPFDLLVPPIIKNVWWVEGAEVGYESEALARSRNPGQLVRKATLTYLA